MKSFRSDIGCQNKSEEEENDRKIEVAMQKFETVFEFSNYSNGTKSVGDAVATSTKNGAFSLVGGGDSVAAVKKFNLQNSVSYVSTGGGAMLESLEGKKLPCISALEN